MSRAQTKHQLYFPVLKATAAAVGLVLANQANAFQFTLDNGVTGSFDTTLSYGVSIRAQDPSKALIGIANGGTARTVNEDDGNRAYSKNRPFSNIFKVTHDLEAKYEGWGLFVRGLYFVDTESRSRDSLGPTGRDRLGQGVDILDTFVTRKFDLFGSDKTVNVRFGKQVISWGESTFIQNGINTTNAIDVSKLRVPGSELKEALIPTNSLQASMELTQNASLEAFYLFNFDKTKIDPRGSYFSNNDSVSDDSNKVYLSFGRRHDEIGRGPDNPSSNPAFAAFGPFRADASLWISRNDDREAKDRGQYGLAFRYLAPALNNTEFGFYFQNYHSRTPFVSAIRGTPTSIYTGTPAGAAAGQTGTARYFAEYPENIKLYGFSFNTQGPAGIAFQGELSYRPNQPLQVSSTELVLASLGLPNLITGFTFIPGTVSAALPYGASAAGLVAAGTELSGFRRVKATQMQVTATKSFANILAAQQGVLVGEFGYTRYGSLPSDLKFAGPGTALPATFQGAQAGSAGSVQNTGFVTQNSYGYRLVGRLDYLSVLYGGNLSPRVAFSHDVRGVSQTFNHGTKSVSVGANLEYQKKLTFDFSITSFFGGRTYCGTDVIDPRSAALGAQVNPAIPGGGQSTSFCTGANPLKDRDFYSIAVSYSF